MLGLAKSSSMHLTRALKRSVFSLDPYMELPLHMGQTP